LAAVIWRCFDAEIKNKNSNDERKKWSIIYFIPDLLLNDRLHSSNDIFWPGIQELRHPFD
jgi:hypothetical protein